MNTILHAIRAFKVKWKTAGTYLAIFGAMGLVHIAYRLSSKRKKVASVHSRWSRHPLYIRVNSSDVTVFRQVFIDAEYAIADDLTLQGGTVIDGGANIDLTSVFLGERHPGVAICAIEPDLSNFPVLEANTACYPNVRCLRAALWRREGTVRIADKRDRERRSEWRKRRPLMMPISSALRLSTLFDRIGGARVALLKLDVEGAEKDVLEDAAGWVDRVDHIVIELHETLRLGCTALFRSAVEAFDIVAQGRELALASRKPGR